MSDAIKIRIGDIEIECSGDSPEVRRTLSEALDVLKEKLPDRFGSETASSQRPPTVTELLLRARARSFGDKAIVVAWWLQEHGGRPRWRTGDIVEGLEKAGEPLPSNMTDALNYKAKQGLFEVRDRLWELTEKGKGWFESLVELDDPGPDG